MTAFKDFLGAKDVKWWDGIARTFTRLTSTGGQLTQNKIGHMVDVLEVYGDGTAYTDTTLNTAAGTVGANNVCFLLQPGTWVLAENVTLASNITLFVPRGTTLQIAAGKTLTINGTLEAGEYIIFTGTGIVAGTPKIRIKDPTWISGPTDNLYPSNPFITWGSASPEAVVTAPVGSMYLRTTLVGSGTTAYYKESGTGNTGWVARSHIGSDAIWHAGNDGAGSGLDADTVDGRNPGSVSGIPTLDANSRVVEPANLVWDGVGNRSASATPAANVVPVRKSASPYALAGAELAMTGMASAENVGIVTTTLDTDVEVASLDLGSVTAEDRIYIAAQSYHTKGATVGSTIATIQKKSGTANITTIHNVVSLGDSTYQPANQADYVGCNGIFRATGSGTLVIQVVVKSKGSTGSIAAADGQIHAFFLKKA